MSADGPPPAVDRTVDRAVDRASAIGPRILVTGARGFVGRSLVGRLIAAGYECHTLVRTPSETPDAVAVEHVCPASGGSVSILSEIIRDSRPDAVIHLASLFLFAHKPEDVDALVESNVLFGTRLLEALSECGVHRLINTGTFWQHYENAAYDPVCLYAATKQAFQDIIDYYVRARALQCITLQLFDTYGPGDLRPKLFAHLEKSAREESELQMSPGFQLLDLVHVDDVVEAYLVALRRLTDGVISEHEVFSVSSGCPLPLREVVACFERAGGRPLAIRWGARPYREREVMSPWQKGRRLPGWRPVVTLEDGIRDLLRSESGRASPLS